MSIDEQETAEGFGFGNETIDRIPCDCGNLTATDLQTTLIP